MRRCADQTDCGYENRDSELFCRACALPLLNTALAGRYVVEALLSKGGYAAVFRGIDRNLSRHIAIKVLLPSKTTQSEREHFLREARIAAALDHPNIAPILDYGRDGPSVFLVMPLYTSGSLRTRLAQVNGPLPVQETSYNFHQLAQALSYAHTRPRPVIHRDIKPENILIHQEDYRLVITDFGIARSLEPGTSIGKTITVRGTVGYMAPEQTSGIVDPRSDQYGSAVVLYEMLTGYHPFDAYGRQVATASSLNSALPPAIDDVIARSLSHRPEERYPDMVAFMQAFDQAYHAVIHPKTAPALVHKPVENGNGQGQSNGAAVGQVRRVTISALPAIALSNKRQTPPQKPVNSSPAAPVRVHNGQPATVKDKCREGDAFLRHQDYAQALQSYEDALKMDPRSFYAWNGKGTALYHQGNYRKALEAYQRASEIEPLNPIVWASAGQALNRLQRSQQALVHFDRALAIDDQYVVAWNGRAEALMEMEKPEEAIQSYENGLKSDPHSFHAWNGIGNARSQLRDFVGAVEAYNQALQVNSRSAVAWCNKAEALIRLGRQRAALDALNEAVEMDRSYARAWLLKADVLETLGNHQDAQKARKRVRPWGLKK